jgi:hypothetical protein
MPLCPQITNTPITVTLTSDFTVTNVIPVLPANTEQLAATNSAAAEALADAAEALAEADLAYTAAIGSLQPSANTIVNASNQITAINGNGITVYAGSSPTSGARVVLNSSGLAGFNAGGSPTFSVSASTGAAVFSGDVTGSAITGGTLNIGGNAIINSSGFLTATGATITGVITATSGSFTGSVTSTSGSIGGFIIGPNYLSSGAGGTGFFINSSSGTGSFGNLFASGTTSLSGSLVLNTGTVTVSAGGNAFNNVGSLGCASVNASGNGSFNTLDVTSTTVFNGANNSFPNITTSTAAANLRWGTTTGGRIFEIVPSSERFKENIVGLNDVYELDSKKLLDLPVRAFSYKNDYLSLGDERSEIMVPGFITEEMDAIYPIAVDYENGLPHNWNEKYIIPGMLALIQDQEKRIKALEGE